ncbi:hypothetical protein CALCODRAFT_533024 [Calocera cornea HHB12733]|uniref:Uncharacterized protein n=1 Tax=Calocera cornea HHB12733 TaxID=1353952 RepID=A0A165CWS8_9BASI|nr:hypothetical protein CALCODRAFT_533024 [Calocera cornea HHB12733]
MIDFELLLSDTWLCLFAYGLFRPFYRRDCSCYCVRKYTANLSVLHRNCPLSDDREDVRHYHIRICAKQIGTCPKAITGFVIPIKEQTLSDKTTVLSKPIMAHISTRTSPGASETPSRDGAEKHIARSRERQDNELPSNVANLPPALGAYNPYPAFGTQPIPTQSSTISMFTEPSPRRGRRKAPETVKLGSRMQGHHNRMPLFSVPDPVAEPSGPQLPLANVNRTAVPLTAGASSKPSIAMRSRPQPPPPPRPVKRPLLSGGELADRHGSEKRPRIDGTAKAPQAQPSTGPAQTAHGAHNTSTVASDPDTAKRGQEAAPGRPPLEVSQAAPQRRLSPSVPRTIQTSGNRETLEAESNRLRIWADNLAKAEDSLRRAEAQVKDRKKLQKELDQAQRQAFNPSLIIWYLTSPPSKIDVLSNKYERSKVELRQKNRELLVLRSTMDQERRRDVAQRPPVNSGPNDESRILPSSPTLVPQSEYRSDPDDGQSRPGGTEGEDELGSGASKGDRGKKQGRKKQIRFDFTEDADDEQDMIPEALKLWCMSALSRTFWSAMGAERSKIIPKYSEDDANVEDTTILVPNFEAPVNSQENRRIRREIVERVLEIAKKTRDGNVLTEHNVKLITKDLLSDLFKTVTWRMLQTDTIRKGVAPSDALRAFQKLALRKQACGAFKTIHQWDPSPLLTEDVMSDEYSTSGEGDDEEAAKVWRKTMAQQAGVRLFHLEKKYVTVWETVVPKFRTPGIDHILYELDDLALPSHKPIAIRVFLGAFHTRIPIKKIPSWVVGTGHLHESSAYDIATFTLVGKFIKPVTGIEDNIRRKIEGCCLVSASWHHVDSGVVFRHLKCGHHDNSEVPEATRRERIVLMQHIDILPEDRIIDLSSDFEEEEEREAESWSDAGAADGLGLDVSRKEESQEYQRDPSFELDLAMPDYMGPPEHWNGSEDLDIQDYGRDQVHDNERYSNQDYLSMDGGREPSLLYQPGEGRHHGSPSAEPFYPQATLAPMFSNDDPASMQVD